MFVLLTCPRKRAVPGWSSEDGVTLVELMALLAVVLIVTSMATPVYQDWVARLDLRAAAAEISSTLTFGRMAAMNRNNTVTVTVDKVGGVIQLSTGGVMPASMMGSHVTALNPQPSTVSFSPLGLRIGGPAGANQLITITNSRGVTYSVVATPGGKVSWCPQAACP